MSVKGIEL